MTINEKPKVCKGDNQLQCLPSITCCRSLEGNSQFEREAGGCEGGALALGGAQQSLARCKGKQLLQIRLYTQDLSFNEEQILCLGCPGSYDPSWTHLDCGLLQLTQCASVMRCDHIPDKECRNSLCQSDADWELWWPAVLDGSCSMRVLGQWLSVDETGGHSPSSLALCGA